MNVILNSTPLLYAGVFLFGLLIGSFLNVVILRLPALLEFDWQCQCRELLELDPGELTHPQGIFFGRSYCPDCRHMIRAWENIPLISYVFLNGKCSACGNQISFRYPLIEFATGLLFVIAILHFGPTIQGLTSLLFLSFLIAMTFIDLDHQLLPDNLTIPLMWTGIILNLWEIHTDVNSSVIGAVLGYLSLWSIYQVFRLLTGKEGMGYGDFKLLAALGAWLGWQSLPLIILLSSVVGATVGLLMMAIGKHEQDKPMPFGPFITFAGWITLIWGSDILGIYFSVSKFG